jgi:hypothetical protein
MRAKRGLSLEVSPLEGRALPSQFGITYAVPGFVHARSQSPALNGTLRGTIHAGIAPPTIFVTGQASFGSAGKVKFVATFDEHFGIDTISLTNGRVTLLNKARMTLAINPTTAIVPLLQFPAVHFTIIHGGTGSGTFHITTFSGTQFVAKVHSGG